MKPIISFALIVVLAITFASCGIKQQSAHPQEPVICINDSLQQIVEEAVTARLAINQAEWGCAVLIDKSGKVVAMFETDSVPHIQEQIEVGTILTPFAVLAAASSGQVDSTSKFVVSKTGYRIGDMTIHDSHPCDTTYRIREAIAISSNIAACQIVQKAFADSIELFNQSMAGMGIIANATNQEELACCALGVDCPVSPMHLTWIYHYLAQGWFSKDWNVAKSGVIEGMHDCVWNNDLGTASVLKWMGDIVDYKAQSNEVAIMGKTGSLRLDESGRKHRISFVGIFPENDPQYTCLVMFNAPQNFPLYDAGMDCGSTVRIIAERILKK